MREPRRAGRIWWTAAALFALRALVPIGYMPAALSEGGPIVLCHGLSAPTLRLLESHTRLHAAADPAADPAGDPAADPATHHGMHPGGAAHPALADSVPDRHHDHWEHCPLGVGASDLAVACAADPAAVAPLAELWADADPASAPIVRVTHYLARAPPA